MALADGEVAPLNAEKVQVHLRQCSECQRAVEELRCLNRLVDAQSRRVPTVQLWPRIEGRLAAEAASAKSVSLAGKFAVLVTLLLLARTLVLTTSQPLEWIVRLGALAFVLGWFILLRENPFTLQPHLIAAKETTP
jgi:anti-sigma factor RsiW